jgi:hypothetical protein
MNEILKSPFPYWGGKRKVAAEIWKRFGVVDNYVEPFFGSGAVLLGCPRPAHTETVNDADGLLSNFWRALRDEGEHVMPADWMVWSWNAGQGYGGQAKERSGNGKRERLWFSPACLNPEPQLL